MKGSAIAAEEVVVRRVIVSQIGLDSLASLPMKCFASSQADGLELQAICQSPAW